MLADMFHFIFVVGVFFSLCEISRGIVIAQKVTMTILTVCYNITHTYRQAHSQTHRVYNLFATYFMGQIWLTVFYLNVYENEAWKKNRKNEWMSERTSKRIDEQKMLKK